MKAVIHTPTNNLQQSTEFYTKLGFRKVNDANPVLFSEGKVLVEINPDRFARAGIKLYKKSWETEEAKLQELVPLWNLKGGRVFTDPSGVWIYLMDSELEIDAPLEENSFGVPGNYMGLSIETADMNRTLQLYEALGFSIAFGSAEQGFVSLSLDGFGIAFMKPLTCPHLFFSPSFTYFNGGNNLPVIEKIRGLQIPVTEEITHFNKDGIVDNIIIRDPGGYGFFVFND